MLRLVFCLPLPGRENHNTPPNPRTNEMASVWLQLCSKTEFWELKSKEADSRSDTTEHINPIRRIIRAGNIMGGLDWKWKNWNKKKPDIGKKKSRAIQIEMAVKTSKVVGSVDEHAARSCRGPVESTYVPAVETWKTDRARSESTWPVFLGHLAERYQGPGRKSHGNYVAPESDSGNEISTARWRSHLSCRHPCAGALK